jgi:hypothetical protein
MSLPTVGAWFKLEHPCCDRISKPRSIEELTANTYIAVDQRTPAGLVVYNGNSIYSVHGHQSPVVNYGGEYLCPLVCGRAS